MDEKELQDQVEKAKQLRESEFLMHLDELIKKYRVKIVPMVIIINGQITQRIEVQAE